MSATLELFPTVNKPRKPNRAVPPAATNGRGNALAAASAFARNISLPSTPPPAPPITRAANYISAKTTGEGPVISGRYEVIIPYREERIIFCETLADAAEVVASARWSDHAKVADVLAFLESAQKGGSIEAGEYGVRVHAPYDNGGVWSAKVRGAQYRPRPKFGVGEKIQLSDDIMPNLLERQVEVTNIKVLNDSRAGKQYLYFVKGRSPYQVKEGDLRPLTEITGSLDFGQLPA